MTKKPTFADQIGRLAERKLTAQGARTPVLWLGFGTMGMIGWSVAIPTLVGAVLGAWLDRTYPGSHSWTLALLVAGLSLGCLNAWHWVALEGDAIQKARK